MHTDSSQVGFRLGRSIKEQLFNNWIICEKYLLDQQNHYHVFINFKKAFDRVYSTKPYGQLSGNTTSMPTSYELLKICKAMPRMESCSMAAQETGSELQLVSDKGICSQQPFLISSLRESYVRHDSVSIGGRLIIIFRFATDIVVNAEKEETSVLIDRLNTTTTRYKTEIGPDKTKVMTNNPNVFSKERSR